MRTPTMTYRFPFLPATLICLMLTALTEVRSDTLFTNRLPDNNGNPNTDVGVLQGNRIGMSLTVAGGDPVTLDKIVIDQRLYDPMEGTNFTTPSFDPSETFQIYSTAGLAPSLFLNSIGSPLYNGSFFQSPQQSIPYFPAVTFNVNAGVVLNPGTYWFVIAGSSTMGWDYSAPNVTPYSPVGIHYPVAPNYGTFYNDGSDHYSPIDTTNPNLTPLFIELDGAVPEPASIVSALIAVTVGIAVSWRRNRSAKRPV